MRNALSGITRRQFTTMIATPLILGVAHSAAAQHGKWEHLGTKEIEGRVDHDKISCHGKEEVPGAPVPGQRGGRAVRSHPGRVREPPTRAYPFRMRVRANGASPALDLAGGYRDITNVEFWYEKASWGKKPEVRLYGRK